MRSDLIQGHCTPEQIGLQSEAVLACLQALDRSENEIHGFVAARHGRIFAESYLYPYGEKLPHTNHSLGKSFTCTGVGLACGDGLLDPDELVVDVFAQEIIRYGIVPDEGMRRMKLRHLMSMTTGMATMPEMDECWVRNFLSAPVPNEPGKCFMYNSVGSCMLGAAVEKRVGMSIHTYMQQRLFDRIGISADEMVWRRYQGMYDAEPGTASTTRTNLRLGMFYARHGCVDGKQLIPRSWMDEAMTKHVETGNGSHADDGAMGYGWQLWMCQTPGMIRFDGGQGQLCLVWPQKDMVIAIHEGGRYPNGVQHVMDIVEALMRSAADDALTDNPSAYAALRTFSDNRSLPKASESAACPCPDQWQGDWVITEGSLRPWIEVAPVQEDFYHLFYSPARNADVRVLRLRLHNDQVVLTMDEETVVEAHLDGRWIPGKTVTVMENLPDYAATACFLGKDKLHISLRWLNSWCCPEITFTLLPEGKMDILVEKNMLADGRAPFSRTTKALRIR